MDFLAPPVNVGADEARTAGDEKIHKEKLNGRREGVERVGACF